MAERNAASERQLGVPESRRKAFKISMDVLGTVEDINEVITMNENVANIACAMFNVLADPPWVYHLSVDNMNDLRTAEFKNWILKCDGKLPHIPYAYIDLAQTIFKCLASFSQNVTNINVLDTKQSLSNLDLTDLSKAGRYIKLFMHRIELNMEMGTADIPIPTFTPSNKNPTILAHEKLCATLLNTAQASNSRGVGNGPTISNKPPANTRKADAAARDHADAAKPSDYSAKRQKFDRNDEKRVAHRKTKGFIIPKSGASLDSIVPKGMQKTVCLAFASIGSDCPKAAQVCDGHHPFQLSDMSKDDQDLLFGHMIKNKSGYICSSMATKSGVVIDNKFKAVLGNASKRT